jgi:hypothetical protein
MSFSDTDRMDFLETRSAAAIERFIARRYSYKPWRSYREVIDEAMQEATENQYGKPQEKT